MKEADLRKWHRTMGIILAVFIILQAGSGLLISVGELFVSHSHANEDTMIPHVDREDGESQLRHGIIGLVHHGAGLIGGIYRVLLSIGLLGMAVSGGRIFLMIRARTKQ